MSKISDYLDDLTDDEIDLLDGWAGSMDWRGELCAGNITVEALLAQAEDLRERYPTAEDESED